MNYPSDHATEATADHVLGLARIPHDLHGSVVSIYDEQGRGYNDCGYVHVVRADGYDTTYLLLVPRQQHRLRVRITGTDNQGKRATLAAWVKAGGDDETLENNG